jgi:hypothetical protein
LAALRATGADFLEALALVVQAHGTEGVAPCIQDWMAIWRDLRFALPFLDGVAALDENLAQAVLSAWGRDRRVHGDLAFGHDGSGSWIRSLPPGMVVEGDVRVFNRGRAPDLPEGFNVRGDMWLLFAEIASMPRGLVVGGNLNLAHTPLERLPRGLFVGGYLNLHGSGIRTLPTDLRVGETLTLTGCQAWDGRIPKAARLGEWVYTDMHPNGVRLDEWRELHPRGERG